MGFARTIMALFDKSQCNRSSQAQIGKVSDHLTALQEQLRNLFFCCRFAFPDKDMASGEAHLQAPIHASFGLLLYCRMLWPVEEIGNNSVMP